MTTTQRIVNDAAPHFEYALTPPVPDDEARKAALAITDARSLQDLQVLAYARYYGAIEWHEAMDRVNDCARVAEVLRDYLRGLDSVDDDAMTQALSGNRAAYSARARGGSAAEGWAFAIFDLLHDARSSAWLQTLSIDDPARIAIRWCLQGEISGGDLDSVVWKCAAIGDALHIAAAGTLAEQSMDAELNGLGFMTQLAALPRIPRAAISGRVLSRLLQEHHLTHGLEEYARRARNLIQRLTFEASQWIQAPTDLKQAFKGSEKDDRVLCLLLSLPLPGNVRKAGTDIAQNVLWRSFARIERFEDIRLQVMPYIGGWTLETLAQCAIEIDLQSSMFDQFVENLRCDEFSHDYSYELYLYDRIRAIVLVALGAIVASEGSSRDKALLEKSRAIISRLSLLPAGAVEVFATDMRVELDKQYGIVVPAS